MASVTKTTVDVQIGDYSYRADVDGNDVLLFRDGVFAGRARWHGDGFDDFPKVLSEDARDALAEAVSHNLLKTWRARSNGTAHDDELVAPPPPASAAASGAAKTSDASNHGQMGNEPGKPSRQGEAEVGVGGPGYDPNSGELGGQAIKPHRRAVADGFRKP